MNRKIGVILSYILIIIEVASVFLLTPFIISTLGQAEYGVFKLAAAINTYLLLLDLGVGNAVIRYVSKYRALNENEKNRKFFGVAIIFYIAIGVLALIIGSILVIIFPKAFAKGLTFNEALLGQKLLRITIINSALTLATSPFNNILVAYEKFAVSRCLLIVQIVVRISLTYVVLKMGLASVGIVIINLLMTIIFRLISILYVFFSIKLFPLFKNIDRHFVKDIVAYSSLILLQMIASQMNSTVDQILIGSLVASSSVVLAIYGVGTLIVQYYQSIGSVFTDIMMPGVVKMVEEDSPVQVLTDEMIRIGRIILLILSIIFACFIINGKEFITLWTGVENQDAYYVSALLMSAHMIILSQAIGTQILWAKNEHKEQAILKLLVVVFNIFLTIFLIKWNALLGATIGTFISLIVGDVAVMNIIFKKKLKISLTYYYKGMLKGIAPSILITLILGLITKRITINGWMGFCIRNAIMLSIYILALLIFGMNNYEKNLLKDLLKGLLNKIHKTKSNS